MPSARRHWKTLAALLFCAVAVGVARASGIGFADVKAVVGGLRDLGPLGLGIFLVIYALATWAMLPASWLHGAAGFLYGPIAGVALAWAASTGFGAVSFALARSRFRPRIEGWLGDHEQLGALDAAVGEGGATLVTLVRLPPVSPYNVVNYLFGLTSVSARSYLVGTAIGGVVPVLVWGVVGASVADLSFAAEAPPWVRVVTITVTVGVTVALTWIARRAVRRPAT